MARPRKYTNEQIVAALIKTKGMVYLAADKIGCEADTIYNRAKSCKAIEAAMRSARGKFLDLAESKLYDALDNGEAWAVQFALKTIGRGRGYAENAVLADLQEQINALRKLIEPDGREPGKAARRTPEHAGGAAGESAGEVHPRPGGDDAGRGPDA